jgi:GT2 family glycosyltransferase
LKTLAVVIVNLNAGKYLADCLRSIFAGTRALRLEVSVIDNGSRDGSPEAARREFPAVRVVVNARNLGFARAANIVLTEIRDSGGADFVLLLNPDTVVPAGALEALAGYLESHPEVAAVSPALVLPDGRFQTGVGGHLPTARTGAAYFFFAAKLFPRVRSFFLDQASWAGKGLAAEVEWLSGACLMVRREVLGRAGLLDEGFFFYGEDIAWGRAMTERGLRLRYWPGVRVLHHHGFFLREEGGRANTLWLGMVYRYVRRERGSAESFVFRLASAAGFFLRWTGHGALALFPGQSRGRRAKARDARKFFLFALFGPKRNPRAAVGEISGD